MKQGVDDRRGDFQSARLCEMMAAIIAASRACLRALAEMNLADYQRQLQALHALGVEWQRVKTGNLVADSRLARLAFDLRCANRAHATAVQGSQRWMRSLSNVLNPDAGYGGHAGDSAWLRQEK